MKTSLRLLALAPLALLLSIEGAAASALSGTWSGSGVAVPNDGAKEKVSCRISYSPQGAKLVGVNVKCTSTSTKRIVQAGQLKQVGENTYVGQFASAKHAVSGRVTVTVSGSVQTVTFNSNKGHASVTLKKL
jgi:hypothetical protein